MLALAFVVLSIGLADSVNPSTIGPALYLATRKDAVRSLGGFTAGVFLVYLLGGIAVTLGPGQAILAVVPRPGPDATHRIELFLGAGALLLAIALWLGRERIGRRVVRRDRRIAGSPLLLGAGIMAIELPTAFPYFAAIAAIIGSGKSVATQIVLLILFNVAFVVPLLAISALRSIVGRRADRALETLRGQLHRHAALIVPALVLVISAVLVVVGTVGLTTR